ncbi:MAG TPA: GNAT family N-acetyltransferase [Roseiflexaceae bacterium]|nr:GNAT family N-acetyltransferase [Roseiflexaceae bacterium]
MQPFATERLILRPFRLDDAAHLHREIYADPLVLQHYSNRKHADPEQTRLYLADHLAAWQGDLGRHAVIRAEDGRLLGQVHLDSYVNRYYRWRGEADQPFNSVEVELAFAFGRRFWGQGYATEACRAMIAYAFGALRLRRLVGGAHRPNERSVNLQRRLGYRVEDNLLGTGYVTILDNTGDYTPPPQP